jgi:hypothetical protein
MRLRELQSGTLTPEIADEARIILRRVGLALIVLGLLCEDGARVSLLRDAPQLRGQSGARRGSGVR